MDTDSLNFAPKGWDLKKRMNPSWRYQEPSPASEVLETPTLRGLAEHRPNRQGGRFITEIDGLVNGLERLNGSVA